MNERRLEIQLGFDRVRHTIADRCSTEYAVRRVEEEEFSTDPREIRRRLLLTDEMRLIVMFEDGFPAGGFVDCVEMLAALRPERATIDLAGLGRLRTMLQTLGRIGRFFASVKDGVYPNLARLADGITLFPEVDARIDGILDRHGAVKDNASEALYDIRRTLRDKESAISRRAGAILRQAQLDGIAESDAAVSVRDGKMLIPVNSSNKRKLAGFIYDQSATGKTTYIEPAEIVELENDITELRLAESWEIARILQEFSDFLRPYVPALQAGAVVLGEMDFLIAKAQTALDYIAGMPLLSEEGQLQLRKARHPLLERTLRAEGKEIVPLTVTLTPEKHILLISGPNAGGKSVCLKTVGLLQYMFQWGMLIPTSETSEMTVFDRIMVDIGDGQSIDNDLSTYSSFLAQMKRMLAEADDRTLVLIDEFGSGTEPAAGGAIAEAILAQLDSRGVYGVITTHYTNLKLYASSHDSGVVNGAMQFDAARITPLFKLEQGFPGNSFAFELARKMGLPEEIVADAETRAGEAYVDIERNLRRIARGRRALDEKLQHIRHTDKTLETITDRYQKELEGIKQKKKEILDEAKKEAEEIVKDANRKVESTIRTIKESQADKVRTQEARRGLQDFMSTLTASSQSREDYVDGKLQQLQERQRRRQSARLKRMDEAQRAAAEAQEAERKRLEAFRKAPLKVGEKVRIKDGGMVGEVALVSNKAVTVAIGNITSKMPLDKVERISSNEFKAATRTQAHPTVISTVRDPAITERKLSFHPELDIRGARVDEALQTVMHYIDDAIMLDMHSVRIIHGKGTGALREEIQKYLRTVPGITSVSDEHIRFGGTGVTIVNFE